MAKRCNAPAIGIDLGTTYSCVAIWRNDRLEIIPNEQGNRTTPSCVAFTFTDRLIGDAAKNQIALNSVNTVFEELLTGQKNSITITNDKGRLTKEEIENMLEEAEKYRVEDQEFMKRVDAYNSLECYVYHLEKKLKDGNIRKTLSRKDLRQVDDVIEEALKWLDTNKGADASVVSDKKAELEWVCNSIVGEFL